MKRLLILLVVEVLLSTDEDFDAQKVRAILLEMSSRAYPKSYVAQSAKEPNVAAALRRWHAGAAADSGPRL